MPKAQDGAPRPIPVEVRQPNPGALQTVAALIAPVIHPLTTTGIVVIFVIFILSQRQDLRNRVVRLAGARDLQRTTAALDDAGQRLSRLFLSQLALNTAFGVAIGAGLSVIGVPSAPLWGMLAMILRFVPYIGAVISAMFPLILAAAVGPGWTMVLMTVVLFLILEPFFAYAIEPLVFGKSTGLSPVAIIVSATFWTWLWGPIGLILATPLTLCLVVVGRHVDRLNFLEVLLGDQPALTPPEIVYQRMLARDPVEAAEQAQSFLKEKPLGAYYDEILLEGLRLAQTDAERNLLDEERMVRVRDAVAEIVDDLNTHKDQKVNGPSAEEKAVPLAPLNKVEAVQSEFAFPERWLHKNAVLCVPGIGLLDEATAIMIAHLVGRNGISARAEQADTLSMTRLFAWDTSNVCLICICYIESATAAQIRYAIRRVRRRAPDALVLVALLGTNSHTEGLGQSDRTDFVQSSVRATADKIVDIARAHSVQDQPTAMKAAV